jgi:octaprenyl-diphosphate synthase
MAPYVQKIKQGQVTPDEIGQLIEFTEQQGGTRYATSKMNEIADRARQLLTRYEDSPVKTALMEYIDYVIQRKY